MRFEQYPISEEIQRSLSVLDFKKPTDIQFKAIPPILKGEDVLAIAQTGTGKTAAFVIPILDRLHKHKNTHRPDGIKCVVMVPTRELAIQITDVFLTIGKYTRVTTMSVFGGVDQAPQIEQLESRVDVLVSTPGRMFDLVSQGHIRLDRVEILVLDEADHMLDLGFIKDIRDLIRVLPKRRQTLFFSATIDETIKKLAYSLVKNAIRIQVSPKDPVSKNITHAVAYVEMDDKRFFLEKLIQEHPEAKILVFVRTKVRAERVAKAMERVQIVTETIHGDKEQVDRLATMERFKKGEVKVLIATDVSARGIDIPGVEYVVNYDLPDQVENYVHRVGRTGRGREKGRAVSFCSPEEKDMLNEIHAYLGKPIDELTIDKSAYAGIVFESADDGQDWRKLMREHDKETDAYKQKKKKKK